MKKTSSLSIGRVFGFAVLSACLALVLAFGTARPAFAACSDGDGDGYGDPGDASCPNGSATDCDDSNIDIHPGATEFCDGIDNNCVGGVDEGFNVGAACQVHSPSLCLPGDPAGCCLTDGFLICAPDHLSSICQAADVKVWQAEGPVGAANCFDGIDNDCTGQTDHEQASCQGPELCNGFDDDGDSVIDNGPWLPVGSVCTVGIGSCANTGVRVCSGDQSTTVCNTSPKSPQSENTPGTGHCVDGEDNDCDGATDIADSGCETTEICDGLDNDGVLGIDNGFDVGDPCTVAPGTACERTGHKICNPAHTGTVCNVVPGPGSVEGPAGATCGDGVDNDCDGFTDSADPDCNSAALSVSCALPYLTGSNGNDCTGKHKILFTTSGAGPDAVVTAELEAIDLQGNVVKILPVDNGDTAHLASRTNPADFIVTTKRNAKGATHQVFAPVPLLHVTVQDGKNKAEAFCSNIPYLDVVQPANTVSTEAAGDVTHVLAAIPLVDPAHLFIKVDGVDILAGLGLDPATAFPGGPYSGDIDIHGTTAHVANLIVGSAAVGSLSSNTLSMDITGMPCGGHIFVTTGVKRPGSFPDLPATVCDKDDLKDKGNSMSFSIDITSPTPQEVTSAVPTPVTGEVCHGRAITHADINGLDLPLGGMTHTIGDGEDSADTYKLEINTALGQTDLAEEIATGNTPLGTFDPGTNRLIANALDDQGNRALKTFFFATGAVAAPGVGPLSVQVLPDMTADLQKAILSHLGPIAKPGGTVDIPNAFVVGLSPEAVQTIIQSACVAAADFYVEKIHEQIPDGKVVDVRKISGGCSCDPTVTTSVTHIGIDPNAISCPVTFETGKIRVAINLPDLSVTLHAGGSCETDAKLCVPFTDICTPGVCIARTSVNTDITMTVSNVGVRYQITEEQLEGTAAPIPPTKGICKVDPSIECNFDTDCPSDICVVATFSASGPIEAKVECLASICNWIYDGFAAIANFFGAHFQPALVSFTINPDFQKEVGAGKPDPIQLGKMKVDPEAVKAFGHNLRGDLVDVNITTSGLRASLTGKFSTDTPDPTIPETPGATLTPAPPPDPPVPGAGNAYVVMADDSFNQMFASMTTAGKLKTGCQASGKVLNDMFPKDADGGCEAMVLTGNSSGTAFIQGICHAIRGDDCEALPGATSPLTTADGATEQGTCHGVKGDPCLFIPITVGGGLGGTEIGACTFAELIHLNTGLTKDQGLLFCVQDEVPPNLKIQDNPATPEVETTLHLRNLVVAMVVDRTNDGLDATLETTPNCFSAQATTTGDCLVYGACIDVNLFTSMQFQTCADGKPGIVTRYLGMHPNGIQPGVVCSATTAAADETITGTAADNTTVKDTLGSKVDTFTPPICAKGLTLDGFVKFLNPKLIAVETDGNPSFQDYLGVTGDIAP